MSHTPGAAAIIILGGAVGLLALVLAWAALRNDKDNR